jgi:sulfoacetaldehyde acetyltransferase
LLDNPDFAQIATDMGALGIRVGKVGEIAPAMQQALGSGRPAVVEIMVDPKILSEPYRRDALRMPHRAMKKYQS